MSELVEPEGLPIVEELSPAPEAAEVFRRLASRPHAVFFDSALRHPTLGRYSYLSADPFLFLKLPADDGDSLGKLATALTPYQTETLPGLPPFQGGAAGLIGYDLNRQLERIPVPRADEFHVPALAVGLYDVVLAFDHHQRRVWIVSQGFPEVEPQQRRRRAQRRLREFREWLDDRSISASPAKPKNSERLATSALAPQFAVDGPPGLTSNLSREGYLAAIHRAIEYIHAGDVFQVNLAQRLLYPAHNGSVALYLRLRERNPATFAGYFDMGDFQICSASPERFVQVIDRQVETRPIKGTRRRVTPPEADLYVGDELRESEKDRAENVMIVDLLRNDLSRVCEPPSVQVTELCRLETYQYVQHLVSAVRGTLYDELGALDLLRASFPGGSITGAPKVRAMEIIAELEPTARGAYCGSLLWHGFDGSADSNILIRTITAGRGWWQAPVGGGIVAQSEPRREYEETWHKAEGMLRSLR